jgi:hypothetical protein
MIQGDGMSIEAFAMLRSAGIMSILRCVMM